MIFKSYNIYVPTYNRQRPAILSMLDKDPRLKLIFCIRDDVDLSYYKDIIDKYKSRISFLKLKNVHDIGETRRAILDYSKKIDDYCVMIDDGITNINYPNITDAICEAMNFIDESESKLNKEVACYTFFRKGNKFVGVTEKDTTFVGPPLQAFIINNKVINKYNINFKSMKKVGLEDIAFFIDIVRNGCITVSRQDICIEGKLPNVMLDGGNHDFNDKLRFEKLRDKGHRILKSYIGNMYGVMYTKKYRESLQQVLTYCIIDYSYFRDTLINFDKENIDIVKNKFKML